MTALACFRFDTDALAPETRFAAWTAAMPHVALSLPDGAAPESFFCRAMSWSLGSIIISRAQLSPVCWNRSVERDVQDGRDTYNFLLMIRGQWTGLADGRPFALHAGQLGCFDLAHSYEGESTDSDSLAVTFARPTFDGAMPVEPDLHGRTFLTPGGALLSDFLLALERRLPQMGQADAPALARVVLAQFAAGLEIEMGLDPSRSSMDGLLHRARRAIEQKLTDRTLSPERLAQALGISRATLYRIFAPLGGVTAYVQRRRLERVRVHLGDSGDKRSLAELAHTFGFANGSHLSTAFVRTYGLTPTQLRKRTLDAGGSDAGPDPTALYRRWQRHLQSRPT